MAIYFYSNSNKFFEFSNFSQYGFNLKNKFWATVEHYFQAQKFSGLPQEEVIRTAATPKQAKELGRTRSLPLRADWEIVKDDIMREAVLAKFRAHEDLKELLLSTGHDKLIENAPKDYYWGCGQNGNGKNKLGKILMDTRDILM
ncbi:MAG: Swarming motility protein ybiA [Gammaproteobacteria bacterium]|nr:MAG: Swarming motility protein ybiA [Gammaproteobacteria bacterium]RKZ41186.1 MAG: Swarming motility protein ybiA [Gammaproteobacteria bacterium]RKZ73560.1 MAG: Swarming motility protein ybiA [Gammaproteobacteria bacterium]